MHWNVSNPPLFKPGDQSSIIVQLHSEDNKPLLPALALAKWCAVQICFSTFACDTVTFAGTLYELAASCWHLRDCNPHWDPLILPSPSKTLWRGHHLLCLMTCAPYSSLENGTSGMLKESILQENAKCMIGWTPYWYAFSNCCVLSKNVVYVSKSIDNYAF